MIRTLDPQPRGNGRSVLLAPREDVRPAAHGVGERAEAMTACPWMLGGRVGPAPPEERGGRCGAVVPLPSDDHTPRTDWDSAYLDKVDRRYRLVLPK